MQTIAETFRFEERLFKFELHTDTRGSDPQSTMWIWQFDHNVQQVPDIKNEKHWLLIVENLHIPYCVSVDIAKQLCGSLITMHDLGAESEFNPPDFHMADFIYFKPSGKYYSSGTGKVPDDLWLKCFSNETRREAIYDKNGGWPGMKGECEYYIIFIQMHNHEAAETPGYPLLLMPLQEMPK